MKKNFYIWFFVSIPSTYELGLESELQLKLTHSHSSYSKPTQILSVYQVELVPDLPVHIHTSKSCWLECVKFKQKDCDYKHPKFKDPWCYFTNQSRDSGNRVGDVDVCRRTKGAPGKSQNDGGDETNTVND